MGTKVEKSHSTNAAKHVKKTPVNSDSVKVRGVPKDNTLKQKNALNSNRKKNTTKGGVVDKSVGDGKSNKSCTGCFSVPRKSSRVVPVANVKVDVERLMEAKATAAKIKGYEEEAIKQAQIAEKGNQKFFHNPSVAAHKAAYAAKNAADAAVAAQKAAYAAKNAADAKVVFDKQFTQLNGAHNTGDESYPDELKVDIDPTDVQKYIENAQLAAASAKMDAALAVILQLAPNLHVSVKEQILNHTNIRYLNPSDMSVEYVCSNYPITVIKQLIQGHLEAAHKVLYEENTTKHKVLDEENTTKHKVLDVENTTKTQQRKLATPAELAELAKTAFEGSYKLSTGKFLKEIHQSIIKQTKIQYNSENVNLIFPLSWEKSDKKWASILHILVTSYGNYEVRSKVSADRMLIEVMHSGFQTPIITFAWYERGHREDQMSVVEVFIGYIGNMANKPFNLDGFPKEIHYEDHLFLRGDKNALDTASIIAKTKNEELERALDNFKSSKIYKKLNQHKNIIP